MFNIYAYERRAKDECLLNFYRHQKENTLERTKGKLVAGAYWQEMTTALP